MIRTYKFKLVPTIEQIQTIEWSLDMCRWLYNSMLEQRRFAYKRRGLSLSYHQQATELPSLKKELPAFKQIYSQVLQQVVKGLLVQKDGCTAGLHRIGSWG
ncbi:helix-turn-helix domain-containing protein [Desmospora profundinema]|uniref:Transposase n=1 Tax=Desmospora profundinema TaxID=1571184 RepID=A0ABU1IIJ3_9BACL|nr:helix-turn-helix domain-containing protein [Desmospora profundinema]MDR6224588.1 transposase [Desmospora profundinema]